MSYVPQLLVVAGVMLLACASPGPDLIAVLSQALARRRAGLWLAAGIAVSHALWATLAVFGLGLILSELAWLYAAIRIVGALYLLYLGATMLLSLRRPPAELAVAHGPERGPRAAFQRGLTVGLTNPKAAAFFGSLFVTILPSHAPGWVHGATVAIVALVSIAWFSSVALLFSTGRVQRGYARLRRPIDALAGSLLIALGARLALDR